MKKSSKTEIVNLTEDDSAVDSNYIPNNPRPVRKSFFKRKKFRRLILIAIILLVVVGSYGMYYQSDYAKKLRADKAVQSIIKEVGKLIVLPVNETPTIFDVTDPEKLIREQPFFIGVQSGDKLLIYNQSAKVIVYSPKLKKIINVGPLTTGQ